MNRSIGPRYISGWKTSRLPSYAQIIPTAITTRVAQIRYSNSTILHHPFRPDFPVQNGSHHAGNTAAETFPSKTECGFGCRGAHFLQPAAMLSGPIDALCDG